MDNYYSYPSIHNDNAQQPMSFVINLSSRIYLNDILDLGIRFWQDEQHYYFISLNPMNFLKELLDSKTPFCTHDCGCIISALKQTLKNLKYGLVISGVMQLVRSLKTIIKNPGKWKESLNPQYLTITIFLCATVLTLRLVKCILRRLRQRDDGLNSLLAGAAAGWVATKTLSKDYWYFYLTLIGSRIIGAVHRYLISKGILKEENSHLHSYFMMSVAHCVHSYGYFLHPYILKDDMYGLYEKMSALTLEQQKWHTSTMTYNHRRVNEIYGPAPQFDKISAARIRRLQEIVRRKQEHNHS